MNLSTKAFLVVLALFITPAAVAAPDMERELLAPVVILLNRVDEGLGSGVIVERQGSLYWVLTANHVVGTATRLDVVFKKEQKPYQARLVAFDATRDLALLVVDIKDRNVTPSTFCTTPVRLFETVIAVGAGFGDPIFATYGWIANLDIRLPDVPTVHHIHHTSPIAPGNSGGPLFKLENNHYCVMGINVRARSGATQFSIAVALDEILSFLK